MELPRIVISGASGFVGRHLLDALKGRYKIFALARRSQRQSGAPVHPNILWHRADIGDIESLETIFKKISDTGGAETFIHLAAYYDFSGVEHQEYLRTNVTGLRNILELCKPLKLGRFIFSSSTAACSFPPSGKVLNETSPADGEHIYARTKRAGEEMLAEYADSVPSLVIRFPVLFSDWCEYPPLYMFFGTWLSDAWTSRVLAGKGLSSVPYLHIRDLVSFFQTLLNRLGVIEKGKVMIAGGDGSVNHLELFEAANLAYHSQRRKAVFLPKLLCAPGIWARNLLGKFTAQRSFESPWMCKYIDLQMNVDAGKTREILEWEPRTRLEVLRRIPFMVENLRAEPAEWYKRNTAALKEVPLVLHLKIHNLLKAHTQDIDIALTEHIFGPKGEDRFASYRDIPQDQQQWSSRQLVQQLQHSIRTHDKSLFRAYCQDIAEHRFEHGFTVQEVCDALALLNQVCLKILGDDPNVKELPKNALKDYISMSIQFGIDEVQEVFEQWGAGGYQPHEFKIED